MKIKKSFIRIALAAGLVGLAACSGSSSSDTTVVRQKNAALATNVQKYVGSMTTDIWEGDPNTDYTKASFRKNDAFKFSFDLNLDAVDLNKSAPTSIANCSVYINNVYTNKTGADCDAYPNNSWYRRSLEADFRNAFSNFSISGVSTNTGTLDVSKIKWAKCPLSTEFRENYVQWPGNDADYRKLAKQPTNESLGLTVTFVEAPDDSFVNADCNGTPSTFEQSYMMGYPGSSSVPRVLYDSTGKAVAATGAIFRVQFNGKWENNTTNLLATFPADTAAPTLKQVLPTGIDGLVNSGKIDNYTTMIPSKEITQTYVSNGQNYSYSYKEYLNGKIQSLSSSKVKDYAPFELAATVDASGIAASWKRSADLVATDPVTHVVQWSTDGFTNQIETIKTLGETLALPSCSLDPKDSLSVGATISVRVYALDPNAIPSASTNVATVKKTAGTIVCPTAKLAAPKIVASSFSIENMEYTISWSAPADAGTSAISYCVESSTDAFATEDYLYGECGITETTHNLWWLGTPTASFRVSASRDTGTVSPASVSVDVKSPETAPVTNAKATLSGDDVRVSWTNSQVSGVDNKTAQISWGIQGKTERGLQIGSGYIQGANNYLIVASELGEGFVPGTTVWIDIQANSDFGLSKPTTTSYLYPVPATAVATTVATATTLAPVTTLAPAADATAKAAVITPAATEVQLPADQNITIVVNSAEVAKGFAVPEKDIKSIEYRVAKGVWKALSKQASLNIPKSASNFSVRVTKNDGKTVVSEKNIVRSAYSVAAGATTAKSKLLSLANLTSPAGSKYAIKVSSASKSICKVAGTGIKAVKKGTCSVNVSVTPAGKKATSKSVKITVK